MMPFAGWDMPLWYTSIKEEHQAVRNAAGLFDVSHMGVYQVSGKDACAFLDSVCGNDISALEVGDTCYTHFLDLDANVTMISSSMRSNRRNIWLWSHRMMTKIGLG